MTLYCTFLNENESSSLDWYLNLILFVPFGQTEARGLNHTSRKRLSCWNFYELWASRFTGGQTFFASVTRKAPFISSFVFNPRILLDDNLPPSLSDPMAPWKIRHRYRFFTRPISFLIVNVIFISWLLLIESTRNEAWKNE